MIAGDALPSSPPVGGRGGAPEGRDGEGGIRPVRLQLSRRAGFRLQEHSRATNGLPAVNVARPGKWGNPYRVGDPFYNGATGRTRKSGLTAREAVEKFRRYECTAARSGEIIRELRGKNIACWCALDAPCHGDVYLDLANRPLSCEPIIRKD